jgi:hypothetical protein
MRYMGPYKPHREYNNTTLLAAGCSSCPGSHARPVLIFYLSGMGSLRVVTPHHPGALHHLFLSTASVPSATGGVLLLSFMFPDKGVIFDVGGLQILAGNI